MTLISGTAQTKNYELNIALVNNPLLSIDQIKESAYAIIEMNKENTFSNIPVGLYYIVAYNKKTGDKYGYSDVEVERGEIKVAYVDFPV